MKKFLFFLLILPLIGCNAIQKKNKSIAIFDCPSVFFSSKDNIYVASEQDKISIDNINMRAELNNFVINTNCMESNGVGIIPIDILIIVKPLDNFSISEVDIPLYVSLLDSSNNVLETQYFNTSGIIRRNAEQKKFIETDLKDILTIVTKNYTVAQIVIGFMIDNQKREILG